MGQDTSNQLAGIHAFSLTDEGRRHLDLRRSKCVDPVLLNNKILDSVRDSNVQERRLQELDMLERMDGNIVSSACPTWPLATAGLGIIRYIGHFCHRRRVGIVGMRAPDTYGLDIAGRIAKFAAESDIVVVSGGALGIDGQAHRSSLHAGGRTIVVLGSGLLQRSPKRHSKLFERAREHGAVMSPFHMTTRPSKWTFPYRNPWIAALVTDLIVVQAGYGSGALQTARHALKMGTRVWVVPGPMDNPRHHGCHLLLKEGAEILLNHSDWLADPRIEFDLQEPKEPQMDLHYWQLFDDKPRSLEDVYRQNSCSLEKLTAASVRLEASGWLGRHQGAYFIRRYTGRV
ncbi:MAG: DNA-processing protein DprA [Myxococcota bacterium]|nr:DNA-processing protein DprA [Myxococcota bacterium]